jgi:metal-sulfur cluster biosynthetic enzyme
MGASEPRATIDGVSRLDTPDSVGTTPTEDGVRAALRNVMDPELGADIVELGMVTSIRISGGDVDVEVALTIAGCPLRAQIQRDVDTFVGSLPGVDRGHGRRPEAGSHGPGPIAGT